MQAFYLLALDPSRKPLPITTVTDFARQEALLTRWSRYLTVSAEKQHQCGYWKGISKDVSTISVMTGCLKIFR
ncbi:hypothetical protein BB987_16790 [Photorhabdus temperata]|uniref:Uncharacterized protein n=1 Tax=Photorhabdus khanii NC19 TaxID=1004151 RepID=W3V7L9_9GAMM|nr:hypothetical protein PTE_01940 [Photorhabdus khanii NC19]OHV51502.1 hypothetical protein BB987_16790 [Photorhabdus temperata]